MLVHSLEHVGSYAYPDKPIELDLDALPPLVAVHGPNGMGKTTLLDLIASPFYLTMLFRGGPLHRHFVKKGYIKVRWSLPGEGVYLSSILVDPDSGRTEATLHDAENPGPALCGPLQSDYLKYVTKRLPPIDLYKCTGYAVQPSATSKDNAMSFILADRADRRAIMTTLLNLQKYGQRAAMAGDAKKAAEQKLDEARAIMQRLEDKVQTEGLDAEADTIADARQGKMRAIEQATLQVQNLTVRGSRLAAEIIVKQRDLDGKDVEIKALDGLAKKIADIEQRLTNNRALLDQGQAIRDAAAALPRYRAAREDAAAALVPLRKSIEADDIAIKALNESRNAETGLAGKLKTKSVEITNAQGLVASAARVAGMINDVPCQGEGIYGSCKLLSEAFENRKLLPDLRDMVRRRENEKAVLEGQQTNRDYRAEIQARETAKQATKAKITAHEQSIKAMDAELAECEKLANKLGYLEAAEVRITELEAELATVTAEVVSRTRDMERFATAEAELTALRAQEKDLTDEAARLQKQVFDDGETIRTLDADLARVQARREQALAAQDEYRAAEEAERVAAERVEDMALLQRGFGTTGIQALKVDEALPELGQGATDLLAEALRERRFEIKLVSQKPDAKEKKLLETLDILIERGTETVDVKDLSPGEGVLVTEGVALSIALYMMGRSQYRISMLMRDEVTAPLDAVRATGYVRMLRRVAQLKQFQRVFFISHHEKALDAADGRIYVSGGKLSVS